jgi:excisionase family DNA binding protein
MTRRSPWQRLTVEEAGTLLGLSHTLAYELVRRSEIPLLRLGRRVLVPVPAPRRVSLGATVADAFDAAMRTCRHHSIRRRSTGWRSAAGCSTKAQGEVAAPEPHSSEALLTMHDACELFLVLAAEHLNVDLPKHVQFEDYWAQIESPANVKLPTSAPGDARSRLPGSERRHLGAPGSRGGVEADRPAAQPGFAPERRGNCLMLRFAPARRNGERDRRRDPSSQVIGWWRTDQRRFS